MYQRFDIQANSLEKLHFLTHLCISMCLYIFHNEEKLIVLPKKYQHIILYEVNWRKILSNYFLHVEFSSIMTNCFGLYG